MYYVNENDNELTCDACLQVVEMQLDLSSSGMSLNPGDSIGICPQNPSALVDALLQRLQLDPQQV